MKIDVLLQPCAISAFAQGESVGTLCVVFDVLRATSTMLTGLEWGVREFFVVGTIEAALAMREQRPEALLGGERGGDRIAGFDLGNSPLEYQAPVGRSVIMTTTNGTVALQACARASAVLVGAVVNLSALVGAVQAMRPQRVVAVCAGTGAGVALAFWAMAAGAVRASAARHARTSRVPRGAGALAEKGEIRGVVIESSTHFDDGARAIALSDDVQ